MNNQILNKAVLFALIWSFTYYFVRRGLNPDNVGKLDTFRNDAIYGGLATAVSVVLQSFAQKYIG